MAGKYRNGGSGPIVGRNGDRLSAGALGVASRSEALTAESEFQLNDEPPYSGGPQMNSIPFAALWKFQCSLVGLVKQCSSQLISDL